MLRLIMTALSASAALTSSAWGIADNAPSPTPLPTAGESIVFDVYRDGDKRMGTHAVHFEQDGDDLLVSVDIELRAGLGPITVFRYEHQSTERWREGQLIGLNAETFKDGETYRVQAQTTNEGLNVEGETPDAGAISLEFPLSVLPSSHWRGYRTGAYDILNTEHGSELDVTVDYLGEELLAADGVSITAHRYRLSSDLTVDLWYDENGRWAGCQFEARGQTIRYERRADPLRG